MVRHTFGMRAAAVLLALGAAACGDKGGTPEAAPTTAPTTKAPAKPTLTTSYQDLLSFLKDAATAQEVHAVDAGAYSKDASDLYAQGLAANPRIKFRVVSATKKAYCLEAKGAGSLAAYYDSDTGKPTRTPCR